LALIKPKPGTPLYSPNIRTCPKLTITQESPTTIRGTYVKLAHLQRGLDRTSYTMPEHGKLVTFQTTGGVTWGYILSFRPGPLETMVTHFQSLLRLDRTGRVLVQFNPLSGRKHQLRQHSAFLLGAPIVGDHRYGYPDNVGHVKSRIDDGVHKDGYALHCYRMAYKPVVNSLATTEELTGLKFDFCADVPSLKSWGNVWDCVRDHVQEGGFKEMIKLVSGRAQECFERYEVRKIQRDPHGWLRDLKEAEREKKTEKDG
jgi:hypothetical protein